MEIIKKENSLIEIKGEIEATVFDSYKKEALSALSKDLAIDGFRPGHVPENIAEKHIGNDKLLTEMAIRAITVSYPEILKDNNIDAIGQPSISFTKLAFGNPLGFTILTAVIPEIALPDYKKIAKEKRVTEPTEVSEKDVDDFVLKIRKDRAHRKMHEDGHEHENHNSENIADSELPVLTDDLVKEFGDFKNIDDFKEKIKENLKRDKEAELKEKNRVAIVEEIIKETKTEVPALLIETELENMLARLKGDLTNFQIKFEDYLKQINKSEIELREDWKEDAKKRAVLQLVVGEIAKVEKLKLDENKIAEEIKKIKESYKDVNENHARSYLENIFWNEEVMKFLENIK